MEHRPLEEQDLPATDANALDRLKRFGGAKLLSEMIAIFLVSAPERLAAAGTGYERGDAPAAELAFHSLKSSAAQLGAMRLQRLCERGERAAKAGTLDDVPILLKDMQAELDQVREWLIKAREEGVA